uniref:SCO-spondin n=1 Tax=Magallana gigas TaxID=29159 RepID=K1RHQ7_MAGGI
MGCYIPKSCPVNGNWTVWSGWYWCSSVCGPGRQERYRYCVNPKPANGGLPCSGLANESRACEVQPCPSEYNDGNGVNMVKMETTSF